MQKTVEALANQGFEREQIREGLLLLSHENEKNIRKPGAWLRRAVEQRWTNPEADHREKERRANEVIADSVHAAMEREWEQDKTTELSQFWEQKKKEHWKEDA